MKIQSGGPNLANRGDVSSAKSTNPTDVATLGASKNKSAGAAAIADATKVNVSQNAQNANKIQSLAKNTPDVDEAKVAHFKELINSGKYQVNAGAIADKMMQEDEWVSSLAKS